MGRRDGAVPLADAHAVPLADVGPPAKPTFIAEASFGGRRSGYYFGTGSQGPGYYEDVCAATGSPDRQRRRSGGRGPGCESKRLVVESPWSQLTSECQRF
jgi:hypothetical protein